MNNFQIHPFDVMTPQQRQDLAKFSAKAEIECESHERKKYADFVVQKEIDRSKNELALRRMQTVEQNRRNRENAVIDIVQSSDKKLYAIVSYGRDFQEPIECLYGRTGFSSICFFL